MSEREHDDDAVTGAPVVSGSSGATPRWSVWHNGGLAMVYFLSARLGLSLDAVDGVATVVWPPTGISFAALLLYGTRLWPGVAVGAFLANVTVGVPLPASLGIAAGNTLEALTGVYLLRRSGRPEQPLQEPRDIWTFVVLVAGGSTLVSATVGTTCSWLSGVVPSHDYAEAWFMWWVGDAMGNLVVAPLFLSRWPIPRPDFSSQRIEIAGLVSGIAIVSWAAVSFVPGPNPYPGKYVVFPFVIWSALRFGQPGAVLCTLLISVVSISGMTFEEDSPLTLRDRLVFLQTFLAVVAVTGLVLGALVGERQRNELRLQQLLSEAEGSRAEAQAANRSKDEFLAVVSHELRTPLTPILMWSTLMRSRMIAGADADRALEVIESSARVQARLIDDLLDVSRIISGKLLLNMQPFYVAPVIAAAIEAVRGAADNKGIRIEEHVEPATLVGDAARVQQIVWNLLSNSVKFTPRGGLVAIRVRSVTSHVEISVSDNGAGLAPEFLPRMFARFQQSDYTTTRKHGGLGLGLAIVRHLVELHGGSIRAYSDGIGTGSKFVAEFPLPDAAVLAPGSLGARNARPAVSLSNLKVLVVEDDPATLAVVSIILERAGAKVETAKSASEGLGMLQSWLPDVLVSDIGMPEEDGYAFIRRVRRSVVGSGVPALALSAYARDEERRQAIDAGFQVYASKPVDPDELLAAVLRLAREGNRAAH